ncbi:GNAT family N-acetyltransferase [Streptomyces sp. NPDC012794]|uniref:GNAT family N-acetyltransferase n=1 Tax=Streptomyces sp. NPDC012794 TaxID=3364850 RepID=UPI003673BEAC
MLVIERDAGGRDEAGGADVLDLYLQMARARLSPARFEAVVRAVQDTCGLLVQGHQALVAMPGEEGFSPEMQREYLALLAVMITGSLDHRVVELPGPDDEPALAVVRTTSPMARAPRAVARNPLVRLGSAIKNHRMHEMKLSDGTITLSPLRLDDVEAHLAGEDELLVRWLNGGPGTREGVEAYVRHCQEQWDTAGPLRAFGIRTGPDEVLAGTIDLRFAGEGLAPGQVNIAYGLYPCWRGRGLATRAVLLASQYAASEGGAKAVIQVEPENSASAAVAQRAGFAPCKSTRGTDGTRFDWYTRDLHAATL